MQTENERRDRVYPTEMQNRKVLEEEKGRGESKACINHRRPTMDEKRRNKEGPPDGSIKRRALKQPAEADCVENGKERS